MASRVDLLNRLARRAAGAEQRPDQATTARGVAKALDGAGPVEPRRVSRSAALKLGGLGLLSIPLGLWRAPEAKGQGRGECIELCLDASDDLLREGLQSCRVVFGPDGLDKPPGWERIRFSLERGGVFAVVWDATAFNLMMACMLKARRDVRALRTQCYDQCHKNTPTPPRKPPPPQIPPPPPAASADGPCTYCSYFCSPCKAVDAGFICCVLPPEGGKSPCCPA